MTELEITDVLRIAQENNLSEWSRESYQLEISNASSVTLCLKYSGETIGFAVMRLIMNQDYNELHNEAEILNIGVVKSKQNEGFGQVLLDELLERCKKNTIKYIWLEVRKSNLSATAFYKKNNFSVEFERKNYYTNPLENALIMKKLL